MAKRERKDDKTEAKYNSRYGSQERLEIIKEVESGKSMVEVAKKHNIHPVTIKRWIKSRELSRTENDPEGLKGLEPQAPIPRDSHPLVSEETREKIIKLKKEYPYMGPAQIRNQLRRFDAIRLSVKLISRVLKEAGFELEKRAKLGDKEITRFEMSHRNELFQMDILHFRIGKEASYLFVLLDDYSRFLPGWGLYREATSSNAIEIVNKAIKRHGRPEAILTDRGFQFNSWVGLNEFERMLEALQIDHHKSRAYHPQTLGKIEAFNKSIQRELIDVYHFESFSEAEEKTGEWIEYYNYRRTHMGIGGLTPADRYFGREQEVLKAIEKRYRQRRWEDSGRVEDITKEPPFDNMVEILQLTLREGSLELHFCGKRFLLA